ncbi:8916_t:CDS:2, partial [Funneliformis geosporum]
MAKLPKNHPIIVELTKKVEYAQKYAKEESREMKRKMGIQLKKIFDQQLAKHKDKTEKLLQELRIIASQKKNHGKYECIRCDNRLKTVKEGDEIEFVPGIRVD